jgi:hypothetical protein
MRNIKIGARKGGSRTVVFTSVKLMRTRRHQDKNLPSAYLQKDFIGHRCGIFRKKAPKNAVSGDDLSHTLHL